MRRYVVFLRGMNLGGRRITNEELCDAIGSLGFEKVSAFLASGNVILETPRHAPDKIVCRIEKGLERALGYAVPTFLRSATRVAAIAARDPFVGSTSTGDGKLQVAILRKKPTAESRDAVLAMATRRDQLALDDHELYWLPDGKITDSELDLKVIQALLGPMTVRTHRTVVRIVARFF